MKDTFKKLQPHKRQGFTLVELLVSMAVLSILMMIVSQVIAEAQGAWRQTSSKVSQFRESRRAFDFLKRNLSQAVLNTYVRYRFDNPSDPFSPFTTSGAEIANGAPTGYSRYSELQFVSGPFSSLFSGGAPSDLRVTGHGVFFQAPLGLSGEYSNMPTALNGRGYFVEFGGDDASSLPASAVRPTFLGSRVPAKYRYRLMEYTPPTERNVIYDSTTRNTQSDWFADVTQWRRPVADNVIGLYFAPRRTLGENEASGSDERDIAPNYAYNSSIDPPTGTHPEAQYCQLPPMLDIVMVVIDEGSASRLADLNGATPPLVLPDFTGTALRTGYRESLTALETYLRDHPAKLNYRIYTSTVIMRNSQWGVKN